MKGNKAGGPPLADGEPGDETRGPGGLATHRTVDPGTEQLEARDELLAHLHRGGAFHYLWRLRGKRSTWSATEEPLITLNRQPDVYFGVHPTSCIPETGADGDAAPPEYVRGRVEIIAAVNCLYAEFDGDKFDADDPRGRGLDLALAHIQGLPVPPTALIRSGGGYHAYWLLAEPWLLGTEADREDAAGLQAAWVDLVGGDDGAKDLARVLRLPGTVNAKYADHPRVEIAEWHPERLYTREELADLAPAATPKRTAGRTTRHVDEGAPDGERNVEAHKYASRLRGRGLDRDEAEILMHTFAANCDPPLDRNEWMGCLDSAWDRYVPEDEKVDETFASIGDLDPLRLDDFITGDGSRRRSRLWLLSGDFAELSRVRADQALVGHATQLGWSVGEILALVKAHRRKHDQDPTRGLSAKEIREMTERADDIDRSALGLLGLPSPVVRLLQVGRHDPEFIIELANGDFIELGGARSLERLSSFAEILLKDGIALPDQARRRFRDIVAALMSLREVEAGEDESDILHQRLVQEIAEINDDYRLIGAPAGPTSLQEAIRMDLETGTVYGELYPGGGRDWFFLHVDGTVFVLAERLRQLVIKERHQQLKSATVAAWLRRLKFSKPKESKGRVSVWFHPPGRKQAGGRRRRTQVTVWQSRSGWADMETVRAILEDAERDRATKGDQSRG